MKWFVGTLAVTGCALVLGCGTHEGSSDGFVWHLVRCRPIEKAPSEEIQKAENAFRALPSKYAIIERFEWGRIDNNRFRETHCLLVTFKDRASLSGAAGREYREALAEAAGPYVLAAPVEYFVHDATPQARTATRGHLRRVALFQLKKGITAEEIQKVEDGMSALPSKIIEVERLQWGSWTGHLRPTERFDSATRNGRYCLLLTFKNASARDAYLAHPAYEEFSQMLGQYVSDEPFEFEYVAQGARD
jgi:hypothetical protein